MNNFDKVCPSGNVMTEFPISGVEGIRCPECFVETDYVWGSYICPECGWDSEEEDEEIDDNLE